MPLQGNLRDLPFLNMSEWAKQQACWNALQNRSLGYADSFESCLTLLDTAKASERDERRKKREIDGITAQAEVVRLGRDFWRDFLAQGIADRKLSPKEALNKPAMLPQNASGSAYF
ncbi:MAG: hypothetical protein ACREPE_03720 [Lysobacter sp.]